MEPEAAPDESLMAGPLILLGLLCVQGPPGSSSAGGGPLSTPNLCLILRNLHAEVPGQVECPVSPCIVGRDSHPGTSSPFCRSTSLLVRLGRGDKKGG